MKIPVLSVLNRKIGIDLGTSHTRIWVEGKGIVLNQPTCLAFDKKTKKVLAVGDDAVEMEGRAGKTTTVIYPVRNGEIYDDIAVKELLKIFLDRSVGSVALFNPIMMISVPVGASQAAREIATDVLYSLGAGEAYTIAQSLAASIGSGVPIADSSGSFILHLGEGVNEAVVISLGSVNVAEYSTNSGDYFSREIQFYCHKKMQLSVSRKTVEEIKKTIVSLDIKSQKERLIAGQDIGSESPKEMMLSAKDLFTTTMNYVQRVETLVTKLLTKMPPELAVDVIDKGLLLSGGMASIDMIEHYFVEKLGVPVFVVDSPNQVVISGIGTALENLDLFKQSLGYQE